MRKVQVTFAAALLVLLAACASTGVQADTFNKQVIVANGIVEQAATTVSTLVTAGKLSREDAQRTLDRIREIATGIDIAQKLLPADPVAANAKLDTVIDDLNAVNDDLESHP